MKPVVFLGNSKNVILTFPQGVRSQVGHELYLVQEGREPGDFKPMATIGTGVFELRIRVSPGTYRVIYIAKYRSAVFVLHAFQKKTQKTQESDLKLAAQRLALIKETP